MKRLAASRIPVTSPSWASSITGNRTHRRPQLPHRLQPLRRQPNLLEVRAPDGDHAGDGNAGLLLPGCRSGSPHLRILKNNKGKLVAVDPVAPEGNWVFTASGSAAGMPVLTTRFSPSHDRRDHRLLESGRIGISPPPFPFPSTFPMATPSPTPRRRTTCSSAATTRLLMKPVATSAHTDSTPARPPLATVGAPRPPEGIRRRVPLAAAAFQASDQCGIVGQPGSGHRPRHDRNSRHGACHRGG